DGVLPLISESASVKDDVMTITIANCSLDEEASVNIDVNGFFFREGKARILSSPSVHDHNDFDNPEKVVIKDHEIKIDGKYVNVTLPPFSVVALTLK
ncbi:MAG: alpha-N-arabinofuranosidase, partial [Lachnospiraceae bacterium]|nr:alpha-N-arabinofuranosidase [Lachnospiraceae bacterium]